MHQQLHACILYIHYIFVQFVKLTALLEYLDLSQNFHGKNFHDFHVKNFHDFCMQNLFLTAKIKIYV